MSRIHYFNPGHENAVLNRLPSYTAPSSITTMMRELAALPVWYIPNYDCVLAPDNYDIDYYNQLKKIGFILPNILFSKQLREYDGAEVCMWGISPQAIRVFEGYNRNFSLSLNIPKWNEKYIYLSSRQIASDVLGELKSLSPLYNSISLPLFCSDIESIVAVVKSSLGRLLVKSPYSSSGRGLLWLPQGELTTVEYQVLNGMLKKQEQVSVEPVYTKVFDFAMEFMSDGNGNVSFAGYSLFNTNSKGAYEGNCLIKQSKIVDKIAQFIETSVLSETISLLEKILAKYYGSLYNECIGVDMMIVFENNEYVVHPCVEINMRYNMGYLSLQLFKNFISESSEGNFYLDFDAKSELFSKHLEMEKQHPLSIANGRIVSGYLSLCPIHQNTKYRAYVLVNSLE